MRLEGLAALSDINESERAMRYWRRQASLLALRVNTGRRLARLLPVFVGWSLLITVAVVFVKQGGGEAWPIWIGFSCGSVLLALGVGMIPVRNRFTIQDAFVRLDLHHSLHNRLTSAASGIGPWPDPQADSNHGLAWHWPRIVVPLAVAALLVGASGRMPVRETEGVDRAPIDPPLAWRQMDEWLDTLAEGGSIEKEALEEWAEKVEDLHGQPEDEWYSHKSLESGDTLKDQLETSIRSLAGNLEKTNQALAKFSGMEGNFGGLENPPSFDELIHGIEIAGLPLRKDLLEDLNKVALPDSNMATPVALKDIQEECKQSAVVCAEALGGSGGTPASANVKRDRGAGTARGAGIVPLDLAEEARDLGTQRVEALPNDNGSRAQVGEVVGVGQARHDIERSYAGPKPAGEIDSYGSGGGTVWRNSLAPKEKKILQRYFD